MNFDCTLDSFKLPGMSGINLPFGTKNPNDVPVWDDEAVMNAAMPFMRQRPFLVNEDSTASRTDTHSLFVLTDSGVTLTLGNGGFIGCEVRVINASDGAAAVTFSETEKPLKPGQELTLVWGGIVWTMRGSFDGVNTPDGFGQYQEGRNLLEVLDAATPAEAVAILRGRLNNGASAANGEPDFSGLQIGDRIPGIDLSDIPAENGGTAGQAYNETYQNNDIVISGFNTYLGAGSTENKKNHILFTFKNIPLKKRVNATNDNAGGYTSSELRAFLEGMSGNGTGDKSGVTTAAFMNALKGQIGDCLYTIQKAHSAKSSGSWYNYTVFLPSEIEVFGVPCYGDEGVYMVAVTSPAIAARVGYLTPIQMPVFQKSYKHRIKRYNGNRDWWYLQTPYAAAASSFCNVTTMVMLTLTVLVEWEAAPPLSVSRSGTYLSLPPPCGAG